MDEPRVIRVNDTQININGNGRVPPEVATLLRAHLDGHFEPLDAAQADLTAEGHYGSAWVVLGADLVAIVRPGASEPVRTIPLDDDTDLKILEGIGASRFRVVREGRLLEELRYSRRQSRHFSRLLHRTDADQPPGELDADVPDAHREDDRICSKCDRLIPDWADSCPRCLHKRKILWRLFSYARPYKRWMFVGVFSGAMVTLLQLAPPILTKHLIDDVLSDPETNRQLLWPLILALIGAILLRVLFHYLQMNRLARMGEMMTCDLREHAFEHLQKLSLSYYSKKPTGQLISRVTHDTDRLWDFITFGVIEAGMSVLIILCIAVILFVYSPALALLTLLPIPVAVVLTYAHTRVMHRTFHRLWNKWSRMTSVLSDVIPGVRVVKAFTREAAEVQRFRRHNRDYQDDALKLHAEWTSYWPKIMLLINTGTIIIWGYGAPKVMRGDEGFSLGMFVAFLGFMWMFYGPVEQLGMLNRMFQRAATSAQRVFNILDTPPTIYTRPGAVADAPIRGQVCFRNVSFSYDGVKRVLHDLNFEAETGQMIGLAGPSGSGKTTLINLICRFYDVTEGAVLIDGKDLRNMDLNQLRGEIGVVLQEPYLFRGTIAENIAYGAPDAPIDRVIEAARAANAHEFITGLPDGYDTIVGERGHTLSGGERQRVSIARAVLRNPRILILDEATSSVDTKSEMHIQAAIDRMIQGRTTFAIAHRLSTLRRADKLIILDKGRMVEQGTHEELLESKGLYSKLFETQNELQALVTM
ncbi:MAG: ABC transporter [Phycisphaeraceae bacterium]|nr:ABC transporter [Phycisphaeraceae bacterium]